jgi:UDP-GlcNAc3NAcA epimerase
MKILTILGARPQFIKAGSLSRALKKYSQIQEVIVHTGQHYDENMSDIFFSQLEIPKPDYFLGVGGSTHGVMTGRMIEKIEDVAIIENPDWILVYGDTNSTLAGAIVASKLNVKLAHVEAGLRSFNMKMPEEVNRILTDRISNLLFCPTDQAITNLKNECFDNFNCKVIKSGDIMLDGANFYSNLCIKPYEVNSKDFILSTIHRAENTDNPDKLLSIIDALNEINKEIDVILPLHPRTKKIILSLNYQIDFQIIDPVGYLEMIWLIKNSYMVLTDSGGLQKEAYFFHKACITMRDETEWIELVNGGFNSLVGADTYNIISAYKNRVKIDNFDNGLYGEGKTSEIIIQELINYTS